MIKRITKKWNSMSLVAKASVALIIANFFQKGLSMITGPIFTRIMPIEEYGIISTFLSWQNVLFIIATLNMSQGVFNNGMLDFKEDRDVFCFSIQCLANLCTLLFLIIFLLFHNFFLKVIDMNIYLILLMLLYFIFVPAYNFWIARQRYEFKYKFSTSMMITTSLLSTIFAIIFVLIVPDNIKANARLTATEGVMIVFGIILYIYTMLRAKCKINFQYWKYALKYNLPLIPHYLSMYILASSDRIMITKMVGTAETAIYNVSYTVASILLIFWNSMEASYAPWIYEKMEKKDYNSIKKRGNQILLIFASLMLISTLFAPEIIRILAPSNYYSGVYIIPSVAGGVFFTALYSLYIRIELYFKKTKYIMVASLIGAGLNIILNLVFIPKFGMYAAGYTTFICYIVLAVTHYIILKNIKYNHVYNNRRIFVLSLIIILCTIIVSLIYPYNFLRYLLILIMIFLIIHKKEEVIRIIKK